MYLDFNQETKLKELLNKNQKLITIFLITGILFARCNLGLTVSKWYVLINLLFDGLGFIYCIHLFLQDKEPLKRSIFSPAIAWIVFFSGLVMVYGHFQIRSGADYYSRQITVMTLVPAVVLLVLFFYNKDKILEILSISGAAIIVTTLITSLLYDTEWNLWWDGVYSRVGATPAGGCIDTGNLILVLLIPILYQMLVKKQVKRYIFFLLLGLFQIVGTGSKSSVFPLVFVFAIMIVGASDERKVVIRNLIILIALAVIAFGATMVVPQLYRLIGYRIVELFTGIGATEFDLHTSTGQRMAQIAAFKEHFWETPIFGHGFYAFKEMPYSCIEEVRIVEEISYQHVQLHMNFLEILFSYGIFGFVAYYWFPIYVIVRAFKSNKKAIIIVLSIMISVFFMDLGLDMYYRYLTPYYSYFLAYFMVANFKKEA